MAEAVRACCGVIWRSRACCTCCCVKRSHSLYHVAVTFSRARAEPYCSFRKARS